MLNSLHRYSLFLLPGGPMNYITVINHAGLWRGVLKRTFPRFINFDYHFSISMYIFILYFLSQFFVDLDIFLC